MASADGAARSDHHDDVDWVAAERSPEFRELIKRKRRFVVPATIFFMTWYFGFIVLAGYAPDFMGEQIVNGLTIGYIFALSQFVMVWVLAKWYLNKADREFDPLAEKAASVALEAGKAKKSETATAGAPAAGEQPPEGQPPSGASGAGEVR